MMWTASVDRAHATNCGIAAAGTSQPWRPASVHLRMINVDGARTGPARPWRAFFALIPYMAAYQAAVPRVAFPL